MEPVGKILSQAYQGIGQSEHSQTLRKETRVCPCGENFTAFIKVVGGKDVLDGLTICRDCRNKAEAEERRRILLVELPKIQEEQRDIWFENCNLPLLFASKTFATFERKFQPKAYDLLKKYNPEWDGDAPPHSLVLLSPNLYGVGKTHLVAALITSLIEAGLTASIRRDSNGYRRYPCPAYFIAENSLLSRIRATYNRHKEEGEAETEEDIYQKLERHNLLVIDDVGKVRPRDYSFLQGVYFRIIDSRYTSQEPIILTTNLGFAELENHIGGACADRLREMCGDNFIGMKGASYRIKKSSPIGAHDGIPEA